MAASNTRDCFADQIGKRVIGVLFDALPVGDPAVAAGSKTLIFDDGTGLTVAAAGAFWEESGPDVRQAIAATQAALERAQVDLAQVLTLATAAAAVAVPEPPPPSPATVAPTTEATEA